MGDLWLILGLVAVILLLGFCVWGIVYTPDMTGPPNPAQEWLGTTSLCGGAGLLALAGLAFVMRGN
jgi:hypothetical protein